MAWLNKDIEIFLMAAFALTFLLLFLKHMAGLVIRKPVSALKKRWYRHSKTHS